MSKKASEGWARPIQEPTVTPDARDNGTWHEHPAFASIHAHRVSGGAVLFGSDFLHQSYITVRIATCKLKRDLCTDWHHVSSPPYIEVSLSEAQWATFVSSLNVGSGTPCTLKSRDGQHVPGLPAPVDRREQFAFEQDERHQRAMRSLKEAADAIASSGLSKVKQKELLDKISDAQMNFGSNQRFVAEQFAEHMETTVEAAKMEIHGYIAGATRQLGLEALAAGKAAGLPAPTLELPGAG